MRRPLLASPLALLFAAALGAAEPIDIGDRLELFVDRFLVEKLDGVGLRLREPRPAGVALRFDRPWEGPFSGYPTVIYDGTKYRMYYRGLPSAGRDGSEAEVTCYAESPDGIRWEKPELGLFEVAGTRATNVILAGQAPASHNFSPFLDARPGVPDEERFKALAGTSESGLLAFVSADGVRWRKLREEPVLRDGAFDSQNVAFWSPHERRYVSYFRTWTEGEFRGYRTFSRATSEDFLSWSGSVPADFGDAPREHLYTNQTHPYFRAPHIYIGIPMRFFPGRKALSPERAEALGVHPGYRGDCADAVFISTRDGVRFDRTFLEAFIRPGDDPGNWASRAGLTALGVVPTGPAEMSLYKQAHYAQPTAHIVRYALRTDGFVSASAPYSGGELLTRPLRFRGSELLLNVSTSAAGSVRVEIQDPAGTPVPGFRLEDSEEFVGDEIEARVAWKGGDLAPLAGRAVRLRVVLKDADLYAFRFR